MKHVFFFLGLFSLLEIQPIHAQSLLKGSVKDAETKEPLIAANISIGTKGTTTDFEGNFEITLPAGTYEMVVSYVGYTDDARTLTLSNQATTLEILLQPSLQLKEVTVTADIAVARKTPVAFTNIPTAKLNEQLASQDLPMVLNSTPGAYATQSGGGDGDARVTIRGFNQRNVAVMLDGIPVNDMENGWVYWSNWFGLDLVTKTMQVQRGLGASKLAIPSVGGTINILTSGIEARKQLKFRQEVGNNGFLRSTLGYTSGRLKGGWGVSTALSYKTGNGWVDGTFTEGYFYYLRIDKEIGKHLFSFSGFGAPQQHGQRSFTAQVAMYDTTFARQLGIASDEFGNGIPLNQGLRYNQHWGEFQGEVYNTRNNYYHKPQFSFRHSWNPSSTFYLSNVVYLSLGNGGGTAPVGNQLGSTYRLSNGLLNIDTAYAQNTAVTIFNPDGRAENYLRSSVNNHFWYGLLSTAEYTLNDFFTLSGGLDLRYYEGDHYRSPYDLLGGNYILSPDNERIDPTTRLGVGDKMEYDNTGFVRWAGLFALLEYSKDRWSAFANVSYAQTGYALEDFMKKKVINLADTVLYVGYGETITNGNQTFTLDSPEAQNQRIDWIWRPSFTFKTGASVNLNDQNSIFINAGYLSRAPRFVNVIQDNRNNNLPILTIQNPKNEEISALELGYSFTSKRFSANLNGYYTVWNNKPLDRLPTVLEDPADPDSDRIPVNISGVAALHKGVELDFALVLDEKLSIEGLASIGDWIWNSGATTILPDGGSYEFDATGVHVGDAAQIQLGGLVRYEPIRGLYFKLNVTYFGKNYANFNPEDLKTANGTARLDSWRMPDYTLVDFHSGYRFKISRYFADVRFNILNLLNTTYISDALNNDSFIQSFNDFDAKSASVFFGQGRRWNASFQISF